MLAWDVFLNLLLFLLLLLLSLTVYLFMVGVGAMGHSLRAQVRVESIRRIELRPSGYKATFTP